MATFIQFSVSHDIYLKIHEALAIARSNLLRESFDPGFHAPIPTVWTQQLVYVITPVDKYGLLREVGNIKSVLDDFVTIFLAKMRTSCGSPEDLNLLPKANALYRSRYYPDLLPAILDYI